MALDLSKISLDELVSIQNEVLRNIAIQTKLKLGDNLASTHDSHSSNHSNYSKTAVDLQSQIESLRNQLSQKNSE